MNPPQVVIVGGGLAGLAAAVALAEAPVKVTLLEARRQLAGRAGSYREAETDTLVDHCQHVSMGCCTNLADFCRRTGIARWFRRDERLHFIGPDGRQYDLANTGWLPAPLHLGPSLLRLGYLTVGDRLSVAKALWRLARWRPRPDQPEPTVGDWLTEQRQSPAAIERFWSIVLVSALGEELQAASLSAAQQVFVSGFLTHRNAWHVETPTRPLGELYDHHVADWLQAQGVAIRTGTSVAQLLADARVTGVRLADGQTQPADFVVAAVPWKGIGRLLSPAQRAALPELAITEQIAGSPITALHLWFDRPLMDLPHAVLIDRLSQWVFRRESAEQPPTDRPLHYYQVVISASRGLAGRERQSVLREVLDDLAACFPAGKSARLEHWRMVTATDAVFSPRPDLQGLRPDAESSLPGLLLAGDWTNTGWPATMEGAVRSGYRAAEAIFRQLGAPRRLLVEELPTNRLSRWLFGSHPHPPRKD